MTESFFFGESQLIHAAGLENDNPEEQPSLAEPPIISIDVSHLYHTDQRFPLKDDLMKWVRDISMANNFVLVTTKSDSGAKGRKEYVILGCEKHGAYIPYREPDLVEGTSTQKTGCPFRLKGRRTKDDKGWWLKVMDGRHIHLAAESLVGHNYAGRLNSEAKEDVINQAKTWVPPRKMLASLKEISNQSFSN
ncbi:uncharacterized protein LOC130735151 [Lotus japonicus]|uniref:uncharacterized protein LOC130735151 n=1 Tax=Lotus japonicus TaxID=34305 RepID=UPI00258B261C|nr:uncharacterized protein LOC130735151 [Lotus japonicus]